MENLTNTTEEGKTIAIISYITFIGLIIAFIMNNEKKNDFASYHIRQSLGIFLLWIVVRTFLFIVSFIIYIPFLSGLINLGFIVLLVIGLVSAIQGEKKPIPALGEQFQQWFNTI